MRNNRKFPLFFMVLALFGLAGGSAMAQAERLRFDTPTELNGIELVCTGIGRDARENPAWQVYPLKVEVAGGSGQLLGNIEIAIERGGESVAALVCGGPWVLAQLEPGNYTVTATFEGTVKSGQANVASGSQTRVVLIFPEASGAVSPQYSSSP